MQASQHNCGEEHWKTVAEFSKTGAGYRQAAPDTWGTAKVCCFKVEKMMCLKWKRCVPKRSWDAGSFKGAGQQDALSVGL